jgi:tetratricopeptide (TPR) repeat protein
MTGRTSRLLAAGIAALIAGPWSRGAADAAETYAKWIGDPDYGRCVAAARDNPKEGHRFATAWRRGGAGPAAEHCLALAMLGLGYSQEAAQRLEDLAARVGGGDPALAFELHSRAAGAWSQAAKTERARLAQSAALNLRPDDVELLIDRSIAAVTLGSFWDAVDDLNRAIDLAPRRADALTLRASAYRRLQTLDLAEEDIRRALAAEPGYPDALLERGIVRRIKGDTAGARRDWLAILRAEPESPAADLAREHLERLDVKPR